MYVQYSIFYGNLVPIKMRLNLGIFKALIDLQFGNFDKSIKKDNGRNSGKRKGFVNYNVISPLKQLNNQIDLRID